MDLSFVFKKPLEFIPEEKRPDITEIIEQFENSVQNPIVSEWKGYRFPPNFAAKKTEWQYNHWNPVENGVLVASFPKTGTTWMTQIVKNLIFKDDQEMLKMAQSVLPPVSYVESGTPLNAEIMEKLPWKRNIYGTHLPADLLNMQMLKKRGYKIIYMLRNPKDQLVSWFNMARNFPMKRNDSVNEYFPLDWNTFVDTFIQGKQPSFSKRGEWYPHHILTWYPYRNDDNVMFVYYEDLKQEPKKEIKKVAKFLGVERTDDEISEIINNTSFKNMKKRAPDMLTKLNFFRKGNVADWKNHFTVAQSELMDQKINEVLADTDVKFTYEI